MCVLATDMHILQYSCEYVRRFWRYNDAEENQKLMRSCNGGLFFS